jgi:hypothetical protein
MTRPSGSGDSLARKAARRYGAALAHADAHPCTRTVAEVAGVTTRTARRWSSPGEAQGSPQERYDVLFATSPDAWRYHAHNEATIVQRRMVRLSDRELADRIRQLDADDAIAEGADNAAKVQRGIPPAERAAIAERDAAIELERAACWREIHARGLGENDVYGRLS